jgi:hypothetical protein
VKKLVLAAGAIAAVACVAALLWNEGAGGGSEEGTSAGSSDSRDGVAPTKPPRGPRPRKSDGVEPPASPTDGGSTVARESVDGLAESLRTGDVERQRVAAGALRRLLAADVAARRDVAAALVAADTPEALRAALALVLGTVESPETDPALLAALDRFGSSPEFACAAIHALGAAREAAADDDVFGPADRPFAVGGLGGIGVLVRRVVQDETVRGRIARFLRGGEPEVRVAAAETLRHSLVYPDARAQFAAALGAETDGVVGARLGEPLAGAVRWMPDGDERRRMLDLLLARASVDSFDVYRSDIDDQLRGLPLTSGQRDALAACAAPGRSDDAREFALTLLAKSAVATLHVRGGGGEDAVRETRNLLTVDLASDASEGIRRLAASLLRELPRDDAAIQALASAARNDAAPAVRLAALDTLGQFGNVAAARDAIDAAATDADADVAAKAKDVRARLGPR